MGHSTHFTGAFKFDKKLATEHMLLLRGLGSLVPGDEGWPEDAPRAYMQWEPTKDGTGLQWDGGEKFYEWAKWLQYLVDTYFVPWGYVLSGSLPYREEGEGRGTLSVVDGKVSKEPPTVAPWASVGQREREWLSGHLVRLLNEANEMQDDAVHAAAAVLGLRIGAA